MLFLLVSAPQGFARYRAHYLKVYDEIGQITWEIVTGLPPKNYLSSIRRGVGISAIIKASWICKGNTSFKKVCPLPSPLEPKFAIGDLVEVKLTKHITDAWKGVVEIVLWREDLNSNVYGIRFLANQQFLYGNYYEINLTPADIANSKN
ncbi:MAG: hypothetical protein JJV97_01175 [SAR324 cluster bacterium]|nr:hypothetical protein [SAR324 cluster bacterium]